MKKISGQTFVSISRYAPKWFPPEYIIAKELAPSRDLLQRYKEGLVNSEEYVKVYREETLSVLDPKLIYEKYDGSTLLCYETIGDFCHRSIVRDWFSEHGLITKEFNITRLGIVGSRTYNDYEEFKDIVTRLIAKYKHIELVSGGASGADSLAERYAKEFNIPIKIFKPDWSKGKGAGFIRNVVIWNNIDLCIAFWDGKSRGTEHSLTLATKQKKQLYIYNYKTSNLYSH